MIWLTARIADSSAYLLLDPQPPMKSPTISSEETARKNSTPMFRSATPSPGANGIVAKMSMHGTAVADEVAADRAARPLDARVPLTLRHAHLPDRLHARPRRDRPRGQAVEGLADDPDRLAELDHPHPVARVAVPRGLDGHDEVEVRIRRVRLGAPPVVVHAPTAQDRPRHAQRLAE